MRASLCNPEKVLDKEVFIPQHCPALDAVLALRRQWLAGFPARIARQL